MDRLDEYIESLSSEEKETHKELIDECLKREQENKRNISQAYDSAVLLAETEQRLYTSLNNLRKIAERTEKDVKILQGDLAGKAGYN